VIWDGYTPEIDKDINPRVKLPIRYKEVGIVSLMIVGLLFTSFRLIHEVIGVVKKVRRFIWR
jgi:hypothetical protein